MSPCNIPYCPCDVNYMRKTYSSYDERKPDFIYSKELQIVKDSNNFCFVKEVNSRGEVLCKVIVKVSCDGTFQMLPFKTIPAHDSITLTKDENSIIYINDTDKLLAIHIIKLICMNIFVEVESMKLFLNTRKLQLSVKNIILDPYDTLFTKKLLMGSLKTEIYPDTECSICAENFTKTYKKQGIHMCEHMRDICSDCWEKIIMYGSESCPICRYNFRDNFKEMYEFYAIKIQRFVKKRISLPDDTREPLREHSENICYRCAIIIDGQLVPCRTHSFKDCECNTCKICFGEVLTPIEGHGHSFCMCKHNDRNSRHLIPEEFQHQLDTT